MKKIYKGGTQILDYLKKKHGDLPFLSHNVKGYTF